MIDRIFTLTLTFAVLAGGTLAIGNELLTQPKPADARRIATLPRVVVTGQVQRAQTELAQAELPTGAASNVGARRVVR